MAVPIGGFFASLDMLTNNASFQNAEAKLKSIILPLASMAGIAAGAALAMTKVVESVAKTGVIADMAGFSAEQFQTWSIAMKTAGYSSEAMMDSMSKLDTQMRSLALGDPLNADLAKNLGLLGISFEQFRTASSNQRMMDVFGKAGGMKDQQAAAILVGKTLGSSGEQFYRWMRLTNTSLSDVLNKSSKVNLLNQTDISKAESFSKQANQLQESLKSIGQKFAVTFMSNFTDDLKNLNDWLTAHKGEIIEKINAIAGALASALEKLGGIFEGIVAIFDMVAGKAGADDKMAGAVKKTFGFTPVALAKTTEGWWQKAPVIAYVTNFSDDSSVKNLRRLGYVVKPESEQEKDRAIIASGKRPDLPSWEEADKKWNVTVQVQATPGLSAAAKVQELAK